MFCPKCGTKNPNDGKFCRKCGMDLAIVSEVITGKSSKLVSHNQKHHKKEKLSWESTIRTLFMGLAFLIVSIVLGVTNAANGSQWWFWMLIPAFAMIGSGVAQIIRLKENSQNKISNEFVDDTKQISSQQQGSLPPKQTEFVSNITDSTYNTGDLVPASVVENTTRHLELNKEGETMTLPKDNIN